MSLVNVHNEWDPLEEMIVGIPDNAQVPIAQKDLFAMEYKDHYDDMSKTPSGPYHLQVIEETQEDLEALVTVLEREGVTVRRPDITDHSQLFSSPHWQSDGEYNYCPRDVLLPIGETIIECPMPLRSRFFETFAYKDLLLEYFKSGANWISAPKPRLLDEVFDSDPQSDARIRNLEPLFDAANVVRAGRDIIYLISCSGTKMGYEWLQRVLSNEYRVHALEGIYDGTHLDTTITLLRPGLVLLNPERINRDNIPQPFKNWDVIWAPEMIDTGHSIGWEYSRASIWSGMNFFMINPHLAVVNEAQKPLIKLLTQHKIETIPLKLRHTRTLSGGFHCVTLDIRRRGVLEDYS